jgi:hypothetical protein
MNELLILLGIILATFFVMPLVVVPVLLFFKTRYTKERSLEEITIDPRRLPVFAIFEDVAHELSAEGFERVGEFAAQVARGEMLTCRVFRDERKETVASIRFRTAGKARSLSLAFFSRLSDGHWIVTANDALPLIYPVHLVRLNRYPSCAPGELCRRHREHAAMTDREHSAPGFDLIGEGPAAAIDQLDKEVLSFFLAAGRFVETATDYRLTIAEAYRRYLVVWRSTTLRRPYDVPANAQFPRDPRFVLALPGAEIPGAQERREFPINDLVVAIVCPVAAVLMVAFKGLGASAQESGPHVGDAVVFALIGYPVLLIASAFISMISKAIGGKMAPLRVIKVFKLTGLTSLICVALALFFGNPKPSGGSTEIAGSAVARPSSCGAVQSCGDACTDPKRFERVSEDLIMGTSALFVGGDLVKPRVPCPLSVGNVLSRLWALYGPPDSVQFEGFSYALRDTKTGLVFSVYSAGSGPGYGGDPKRAVELVPVVRSFDDLLVSTKPADCQITFDTDFGKIRSGATGGVPFDQPTAK